MAERERDTPTPHDQTLGAYRLRDVLGEGGMGRVYLADDPRLGRQVALKVLPAETASRPERLARFEREAKAVAALNHPGIVTIHSIEEERGQRFITMEYVPGQTLDRVIPRGGLPLDRFFPLATALADALSAAHQEGIIHRDLKPENVIVGAQGRLKILDFGLAKLRDEGPAFDVDSRTASVTQDGRVIGTVAYTSPEQAQGLDVDHRSDIFSLGILLYEMATGERPFKGETNISVLSAIIKDTPPAVTELRQQLPRPLARMIGRALEKRPEDRYQSALDLRRDLEDLKRDVDTGDLLLSQIRPGMRVPRPRSSRRPLLAAGAAVAVLAGLGAWWNARKEALSEATRDERPSLAVFYFENISGDAELDWLRTGLADMLVTDLSQSPSLRVLGTSRLYQILDGLGRVDGQTSFEDVRAVAREAEVTTALLGSFARAGETIRISARLQDVGSGEVLASERVEGSGEESVFAMVDELTERIRNRFELPRVTGDVNRELREVTTSSLQAYREYVEGFRLHEQLEEREAIPRFERALEHDPDFAMAMAKLAVVHNNLGDQERARGYADRALEHVDRLNDRERYYIEGFAYSLRPETAERSLAAYAKAVELFPDHSSARNNLAQQLIYYERYEEAVEHLDYLRRQRMPFPGTYSSLAEAYTAQGRVPEALAVLEEYANLHPENATAQLYLANFLGGQGRFEPAFRALEAAEALGSDPAESSQARWRLHLLRGDRDDAAAIAELLADAPEPRERWTALTARALQHAYEGRVAAALTDLEQASSLPVGKRYGTPLLEAALLLDAGRPEDALAAASDMLDEKAPHPLQCFTAHMLRAVAHATLGQAREADATFADAERTLEALPEVRRASLRAAMSGLVALASSEPDQAVAQLEKAVAGTSGAYKEDAALGRLWYALARAELARGDEAAARRWLVRLADAHAERLTSPIPWVRSQLLLARIHDRRGEREQARERYARYLDYWRDGELDREDVAEAEARLKALSPSG
jgi:serine/threonine protein kinase/tetratricopeptide (TPR) repeat protein